MDDEEGSAGRSWPTSALNQAAWSASRDMAAEPHKQPSNGHADRVRSNGHTSPAPPADQGDRLAPARPGRLKARYTTGDALGRGALGTTYRGYDHAMQRPVAVKLVADRYAREEGAAQRVMAAAAVAGRLLHRRIGTVLDAGLVDGRPFVVSELIRGRDLRRLLSDREKLPTARATEIVSQVAEALAYAHRQRCVHGDLRPENVLVDDRGAVKVTDFGLFHAAVRSDPPDDISRRAVYTPPEQRGRSAHDVRADVYALGVLAYEALVGRPPSGSDEAGLHPRLHRSDVPVHVDRAVARALSPNPADRPTAEQFRGALAGRPLPALRDGADEASSNVARALPARPATNGRDVAAAPTVEAPVPSWRTSSHRPQRGSRGFSDHAAALVPLVASLAVVAAAVAAIVLVFPRLFGNFQVAEVPTLVDYALDEATAIAAAQGLEVTVVSAQPTDDRAKDTVIAQNPAGGARSRRGNEIKLTLSAGIRPPNVSGKSVDEARAILARSGWSIAGVETQPGASAPAGTVVGSKPGPDEPAEDKRQGMTLYVSAGNLLVRRPSTLSRGEPGPPELTDGDSNTVGKLRSVAPAWVELELAQPSTVAAVELVSGQETPGDTVHEVWVWTTAGVFRGMHTFAGPTRDGQTLSIRFPEPMREVRAVRIASTQAAGEIAWREIRAFDR